MLRYSLHLCDLLIFQKNFVVKRKRQGKSNIIFNYYYAVHLCPKQQYYLTLSFSLSLYIFPFRVDFVRGKRNKGYQNTGILRNDFLVIYFFSFHTHLDERGGGRRVKVQRPAIKDDKGGIKNRLVSEARFALRLAVWKEGEVYARLGER